QVCHQWSNWTLTRALYQQLHILQGHLPPVNQTISNPDNPSEEEPDTIRSSCSRPASVLTDRSRPTARVISDAVLNNQERIAQSL
ncbi:hypothetical protein J4Q44_G00217450, partial [Coregonus suidteri]